MTPTSPPRPVPDPRPGLLSRLDAQRGILHLTLARPEKKNALDPETLALLRAGLEQARDDGRVRVVLLDAQGDVFCAGGDVRVMQESAGDAQEVLRRLRGGLNPVVDLLHGLPKPVVAKVQGNAYGAGAVLAFQCDLTVAAEEASFALSFRHVGLIPDTGGTWLLPRVLGLQRTKHLVWTGAPFGAKDAAQWGLVLKTVPRATLDGTVEALVAALADGPCAAQGEAKRAIHGGLTGTVAASLDREARIQAQVALGAEHAEGRDAFFARRRPDFRRATLHGRDGHT